MCVYMCYVQSLHVCVHACMCLCLCLCVCVLPYKITRLSYPMSSETINDRHFKMKDMGIPQRWCFSDLLCSLVVHLPH